MGQGSHTREGLLLWSSVAATSCHGRGLELWGGAVGVIIAEHGDRNAMCDSTGEGHIIIRHGLFARDPARRNPTSAPASAINKRSITSRICLGRPLAQPDARPGVSSELADAAPDGVPSSSRSSLGEWSSWLAAAVGALPPLLIGGVACDGDDGQRRHRRRRRRRRRPTTTTSPIIIIP